ncbi:MAG TPA: lanthionine synthetase LanC family protein, partial [Blastocatellia bacterium]|nr:lanthionine synthetase LanC family protein [Blastocatellia bacterium]
DEAEEVARGLAPLIEHDRVLDIIGGAAGCIAGLESLNNVRSSDRAITAAALCAERLLATAIPSEGGIAWPGVIQVAKPLTGFSHGAAGMARSLLAASSMTGDRRFREAALGAMEYERAVFVEEEQNWPDFRTGSGSGESRSTGSILAWCHGAPGIGLGRLASLAHYDDPKIRSEIDTALDVTLKRGFGLNHSLCHGDLGNIDLLLEAGVKLDSPLWRERARLLAGVILESINSNGWLCGVPMGVETPGLMTGLAGIGYGLLRLADPARVPSVLSLAPPPAARNGGSPARFQKDTVGESSVLEIAR